MTPEERSARLSRLSNRASEFQPLIDRILDHANQAYIDYAEFFAKLRIAEAGHPAAKKVLLACVDEIELATPAERADILNAILVKRKRGRPKGPTEVGDAYSEAVTDILGRVDDGDEKQADVINELAAALARPELEIESIKTQLRDRVRDERKRRSNGAKIICEDSGGA